jgi:hypothetical protein
LNEARKEKFVVGKNFPTSNKHSNHLHIQSQKKVKVRSIARLGFVPLQGFPLQLGKNPLISQKQ